MTTSAPAMVDSDMALLCIITFRVDLACKHRRDGELSTVMLLNNVVNNGRMYCTLYKYSTYVHSTEAST